MILWRSSYNECSVVKNNNNFCTFARNFKSLSSEPLQSKSILLFIIGHHKVPCAVSFVMAIKLVTLNNFKMCAMDSSFTDVRIRRPIYADIR